jgi:hypothetical protein
MCGGVRNVGRQSEDRFTDTAVTPFDAGRIEPEYLSTGNALRLAAKREAADL